MPQKDKMILAYSWQSQDLKNNKEEGAQQIKPNYFSDPCATAERREIVATRGKISLSPPCYT